MRLAIVITTLGFAGAAFAGTPIKSEFFYQTEMEKQQVTPELTYGSTKTKATAGTQTETKQTLNVKYEYGLNEMLSAGAKIGYQTGSTEPAGGGASTDEKGVTDLNIYMRGQYAWMDGGSFHFGANFNASLGEREVDTAKNENTAMTGGMGLTPYVGYQWLMGKGVIGTKLSTEMDIGDRKVKTKPANTTSKVTGFNETALTGFYEHPFEKGLIGTSVSWIAFNTQETKTSGTTTTTAGGNLWQLKVYPTYDLNETTTILGEVAYTSLLSEKFAGSKDVTDLNIQVGGRFTF